MTQKQFNVLLESQVEICLNLLRSKGEEYAPDLDVEADVGDRLAHFKQAAALLDVSVEQACFGMFAKQIVSVADMCREPEAFTLDRWREKLTDSINYLLILSAIVSRNTAFSVKPDPISDMCRQEAERLMRGKSERCFG